MYCTPGGIFDSDDNIAIDLWFLGNRKPSTPKRRSKSPAGIVVSSRGVSR
jgi:hypothetical protein